MKHRKLKYTLIGILVTASIFISKHATFSAEPYNPGAQLVLDGNKACEKGNFEEAITIYDKAFFIYNSADALFNMGITYEINLKDRKRALFYYQKFLQLEPNSEDANHVREWIKEIQLYLYKQPVSEPTTKAEQANKSTIRRFSNLSSELAELTQHHLKNGNLAAVNGDYQKAVEYYEKVLEIYDSSDAYYNLGTIYAKKLSQPEKAVLNFQKFLELEPKSPQADEIKQWLKKMEPPMADKKQ